MTSNNRDTEAFTSGTKPGTDSRSVAKTEDTTIKVTYKEEQYDSSAEYDDNVKREEEEELLEEECKIVYTRVGINVHPTKIKIGIYRVDNNNESTFNPFEIEADLEEIASKCEPGEVDTESLDKYQYQVMKYLFKGVAGFNEKIASGITDEERPYEGGPSRESDRVEVTSGKREAVNPDGDDDDDLEEYEGDDLVERVQEHYITDMMDQDITMTFPSMFSDREQRKLQLVAQKQGLNIDICIPRIIACAIGYCNKYAQNTKATKTILFNNEDGIMDAIVFQVVDNKPVIYTRGSCPGISDKCLKESIIKTYHDIWEDKYPGWSEPENPYNIDYTVVKERIDELVKVGIKEAYTENKVLYTEFIRDDSNNTSNTESDNAEKDKNSNNLALKFDCSEAVVNAVAKPFMDKCMKMIVELLKNTPSEVALGLERVVFTGEDKQLIPFVKECLKYASVCRVRCLDKHSVIEEAQHYEGLELIGSTTTESQVKEWVEFENQKYSIVQDNQPRIFSGYTHKYDNENSIDIRMNLHSFVQPKLAGRPNQFTLKRDTPKPSHSKKGATASKLRKKPGINTQEGLAEADNTA